MSAPRPGRTVRSMILVFPLAALLAAGGCGSKDDTPKHSSIRGKVTSIDTSTGEVRMLWYNPNEKKEKQITGTLAPEAEIFIDGKTALLKDVMVDDTVTVTGRREKHDGQIKLVAVKVEIRRDGDDEPTSTAPAESPATRPQS
ncbi:MAG: hypothetical protein HY718_20840 [Planctomycetes bacterium]|nr:hypothetical protein [Planctomycetota bacterium]